MTVAVWLVLGILALKLIWNTCVPFVLFKQMRANPASTTSGVSMSSAIEILLLLIAIGLSSVSIGQSWVNRPLAVAGLGVAAIALSYIGLGIVAALGGWIITRKMRSSDNSTPAGGTADDSPLP